MFLSRALVEFICSWLLLHINARVNIAIISDFLLKLMNLPHSYFESKMTGDIIQRIHDHQRIEEFLSNSSLNFLFSFINLLILSAILVLFDLLIFSIFLAGTIAYVLWIFIFMNRRKIIDHKTFSLHATNQSKIIQLIQGVNEIWIFRTILTPVPGILTPLKVGLVL